jgi:hypothetical protein
MDLHAGWMTSEEQLLCHFLLDDSVAYDFNLTPTKVAYLRGFIVKNRESGKMTCRFRLRRSDEDSWYDMEPTNPDEHLSLFAARIKAGLVMATTMFAKKRAPFETELERIKNSFHFFFPPDDGGDPDKTVQWLIDRDLIEIRGAIHGKAN